MVTLWKIQMKSTPAAFVSTRLEREENIRTHPHQLFSSQSLVLRFRKRWHEPSLDRTNHQPTSNTTAISNTNPLVPVPHLHEVDENHGAGMVQLIAVTSKTTQGRYRELRVWWGNTYHKTTWNNLPGRSVCSPQRYPKNAWWNCSYFGII